MLATLGIIVELVGRNRRPEVCLMNLLRAGAELVLQLAGVVMSNGVQPLGRLPRAGRPPEDAGLVQLVALPHRGVLRAAAPSPAEEFGLAVGPVLVHDDLVLVRPVVPGAPDGARILARGHLHRGAAVEEVTVVKVLPLHHVRLLLLLGGPVPAEVVAGHLRGLMVEEHGALLLIGPVGVGHGLSLWPSVSRLSMVVPLDIVGGEPRAPAVRLVLLEERRLAAEELGGELLVPLQRGVHCLLVGLLVRPRRPCGLRPLRRRARRVGAVRQDLRAQEVELLLPRGDAVVLGHERLGHGSQVLLIVAAEQLRGRLVPSLPCRRKLLFERDGRRLEDGRGKGLGITAPGRVVW
mmetsp:Transcript_80637/g.250259  ORF Transcript_80637/g.250259 Transcript_80637/m.250259 type:complete len:350 (-) Transcript_80637:59-1108(-)